MYIVDVFDVDGDGADDLALSGGIYDDNAKPLHSFIVRNDPKSEKPQLVDLGEEGFTRSAWHGLFLREGTDSFFVLGRNGEAASRRGENTAIFKIALEDGAVSVEPAFTAFSRRLTMTVTSCDFDQDGTTEIFINNYGTTVQDDFNSPSVIRLVDGVFKQTPATKWMPWLASYGAHNSIVFADVDMDGDCDLLAALEVAKWSESDTPTFPGMNKSYVLLNEMAYSPIRLSKCHLRILGTTTPRSISSCSTKTGTDVFCALIEIP